MKRFALIICFIIACTLAIAQSNTRHVSVIQTYPLVFGQTVLPSQSEILSSNLYPCNVILDNLPRYEIHYILPQTVYYLEDGVGFYITADSLHSNQVRYSFTLDHTPIGPISLDNISGRFNYYPDAADYLNFTARFVARSGNDSLVQEVLFTMMPTIIPEAVVFQTKGEMPSNQDYTILAQTSTTKHINYEEREAWSYSISGKDIIFDDQLQNKVWGLSGRSDIYELNIYAERVIVRSALRFPQTDITIHAKELIFEDVNNVISSINTSAEKHLTYSNETGLDGGNAGNITLHIKELKCNFGKRFIANGENGQSVNRNGTPGNGGDGGIITSTFNIENFCSVSRGGGGAKFNADGENTEPGEIIGIGQAGNVGIVQQSENTQLWIHPYFVAAVLRHVNDSYVNLYNAYSKLTCNEYYSYIETLQQSSEWDDFDEETQILLRNQQTEINVLLNNLNNGLDYFSNSLGWVPLLSFEVLLQNYDNEIERAIPTLYLSYWLGKVDQTLAQMVAACTEAANQTLNDIEKQQAFLNTIIFQIPILEDKINQLIEQIQILEIKIENKYNELLAKAKNNVKRKNRINKGFGIAKGILNVASIIPGPVGAIAGGLNTALSFAGGYFGISDIYGYGDAVNGILGPLKAMNFSSILGDFSSILQSTNFSDLFSSIGNVYNSVSDPLKTLYSGIMNLNNAFSQSSAPKSDVEKELEKLISESPEWKSMQAELKELTELKIQFKEKLDNVQANMLTTTSELTSNILALDGLRRDAFTGNSKRDLQALQYLSKMEQNTKNRLQKYFYYARKAYEYRLLKPYTSEFSLNTLYERFEAIGLAFDENNPAPLDPNIYSSLTAVYKNEISTMIENILEEYNQGASEVTAPIYFTLTKEQIEALNNNQSLTIDMYKEGFFSPTEENIRIVDFDIHYIEKHNEGNMGTTGYLDLKLEHSGISRLRKNGEIYWFNHIPKNGTNPHIWGIRVDAVTNITTVIKPSFASESLLRAILGNDNNIMLYSRPSAWGDITITKNVHTPGGGDIIIDSVIIKLTYDFTSRPNNIRNIDINVSDELMPFIVSNDKDRFGRSSGKGNFHRSFTTSTQTVSYEAPQYHGAWRFVNWTNRLGQQITANRQLTISKNTDQYYTANYEYYLPILHVPDTIYVNKNGGMAVISVQNRGIEDMDWLASDSISNWVKIVGSYEGINDGIINIMYEANQTDHYRLDSIYIEAPETENYAKTIYILQGTSSQLAVNVSVNNVLYGYATGSGLYDENDIVTVTATAYEGYRFVNWTKNGVVVSSHSSYSFPVIEDVVLVANFVDIEFLPFDLYAVTKWNNTFMLNLKKLEDEGYEVTACKWYKNDEMIGESFTYSVGNKIADQLEVGAVYTFELYTSSHGMLYSTDKVIEKQKSILRAYPNPIPQGSKLTIEGTVQGSLVEVYNLIGACVSRAIATGGVTELTLSIPAGIYIVRSNNEQVKLIIQ
ncbi:MAG: T9SS type A sorting domain-containing protein [Bacteroidetes bacterium]|nr:T9SS type A sorting domain-containing protein [Bacteroidota bacterium]MCL2302090.1 T9SS type A sorting domain-containing protein [Lentimicrobiaceae bacterium]